MTQQLTGINSIMYYGTRVLEESGMSENEAMLANIAFGVVAVLGGIIALRNMDRLDRRKTFLIGLSLTTTCHCLVGVASMLLPAGNPARPFVILALVTAFVLSMQTFLNIAVWVWLAEVFPLHMRGLGFGISAFFGWTTNGFLALFFPSLVAGNRHHRVVLPLRSHRRGSASVRLVAGARDPRPFPRGARRGRDDRGDLRRYALLAATRRVRRRDAPRDVLSDRRRSYLQRQQMPELRAVTPDHADADSVEDQRPAVAYEVDCTLSGDPLLRYG